MVSDRHHTSTVLLHVGDHVGRHHGGFVDDYEIVPTIELETLFPSHELFRHVVDERAVEEPVDGATEGEIGLGIAGGVEEVSPGPVELDVTVGKRSVGGRYAGSVELLADDARGSAGEGDVGDLQVGHFGSEEAKESALTCSRKSANSQYRSAATSPIKHRLVDGALIGREAGAGEGTQDAVSMNFACTSVVFSEIFLIDHPYRIHITTPKVR